MRSQGFGHGPIRTLQSAPPGPDGPEPADSSLSHVVLNPSTEVFCQERDEERGGEKDDCVEVKAALVRIYRHRAKDTPARLLS